MVGSSRNPVLTTMQAVASVGTFLIFVVTALAGLRQLRAYTRSNQLAGLQAVSSHYNNAEFERWFTFALNELPKRMADSSFRESLRNNPVDRDVHLEIRLAEWYEEVGILAKYGVVDEEPLIEFLRGGPETAWRVLQPTVSLYREIWGQSYYRNFEDLAECSRRFYTKRDPKRARIADERS